MVLLDAQIPQVKPLGPQGRQQLVAVVLQGLQPGPRRRPHAQHPRLQAQRPAVGRQLGARQPRPGLPERRQVGLPRRRTMMPTLASLWPRPATTMGFFDRLSRLFRANANAVISSLEDPGKILDQSVADMQADLVKLRQAVATAIASQKRIQNQAEQAAAQAGTWYERAELALKKGEEDLAREALARRKTYQDTATALNAQLQSQAGQVDTLKKSLVALEAKIAEAKTKKDMLKARAQAAQAQEQLQSAVSNLGTNSAMAAFERMEEKVATLEARSAAVGELAGADLESQFAALEGAPEVDDELAALKQRLSDSPVAPSLPAADAPLEPVQVKEVDGELEQLKRSIDQL
jgi:phage shock protein A